MNALQSNRAGQLTRLSGTNVTTAFLAERAAVIQLGAIQQRRSDEIAEKRAARIVKAVEVCRLVIPAALIAMIVASAQLKSDGANDAAMLAPALSGPVRSVTAEYFPDQYVNQANTASEHIDAF